MPKILFSVIVFLAIMTVGCQPVEVIVVATPQTETESPTLEATSGIPTLMPFERSTPLPTIASNPSQALPTATYNLPVTSTLPPITLVFPATPTPEPCTPRDDWTATYTIQPGDSLFGIASLYSVTTAELQTANCLSNANQIFSGTNLLVPFDLTPTATTTG